MTIYPTDKPVKFERKTVEAVVASRPVDSKPTIVQRK
jgi:hypothetical protein